MVEDREETSGELHVLQVTGHHGYVLLFLGDAVNLMNANVIVRLFFGKRMGKSTLFDFIEKFVRVRKDLLREIAKELGMKYGQAYLPSSALYEGIEWLVDSSLLDLPPGKTNLDMLEKFRLDALSLELIARIRSIQSTLKFTFRERLRRHSTR
ncbi:hypothetical protein [Metallosphaera sedula]|uniref:hypothetical protein n=1 Tax=Metallosphaera sedula TaxID=43687 RepID=UPI0020BE8DE5|nr:hypothetical protein [Metallosphaera sedula]